MLFAPHSNSITDNAFRNAGLSAQQQRKNATALQLDLYNGALTDHLLAQIQRVYKNPEQISPVSINIIKKIVNRLGCVYLADATRTIDGGEQDQAIYGSIEDSAGLPTKMKTANRLSKLCGNALLRPVWRGGKMALDVLTGDILDVVTGDSPEELVSVTVTHWPDNGKSNEITYTVWTSAEVTHLDYRGAVTATEQNPYGVLPFVPVWGTPPTDSFWQVGSEDLVLVQNAINERLTDLCHTLRFQSFGVGYVKGTKGNKTNSGDMALGPGSMVFLPENGEVGFVSPKAPVEDVLEAIDRMMKWAAVSYSLPASSMSLDPTQESGVSKIVSNSELEELRRDDIAQFAKVEDQLFRLFRTVWNVHNPDSLISEAATLRADFYDPKPTVTATEQIKEWQGLLELGLISPVDILIQQNPDLTPDMARAKLLQIRDDLKEFQSFTV